ncbi:MAG: hypothetical protein ACK5P6_11160 [Pseudobdellovibrionaceae bacterium]
MILELLQTLTGHIIGHRILANAASSSHFPRKTVDTLLLLSFCLNLILISLMNAAWVFTVFYFLVLSLAFFRGPWTLTLIRKALWHKAEEVVLNQIYLKMRSGVFLTQAIRETCSKQPKWIQTQFEREMKGWEKGEKSLNHEIFGSVFQEMGEILRHNSRPSERIQSILRQKRLINKFRRKSSAAVSQIRAQAAVISVMYWAIFLWRSVFAEEKIGLNLLLLSFILYIAGCLALIFIGRSFRWKV